MGVHGLLPIIRKVASEGIRWLQPEFFSKYYPVLAVDGNLLLYRFFRSPNTPLHTNYQHVLWALKLSRYCRKLKTSPIVVFDNLKPNDFKAEEHEKRSLISSQIVNQRQVVQEQMYFLCNLKNCLIDNNFPTGYFYYEIGPLLSQIGKLLFDLRSLNERDNPFHAQNNAENLENATFVRLIVDKLNDREKTLMIQEKKNHLIHSLRQLLAFSEINDFPSEIRSYLEFILSNLDLECLTLCLKIIKGILTLDELQKAIKLKQTELDKLERRLYRPSPQNIFEIFEIFKILGIPASFSPIGVEAEAFASAISQNNLAYAVATQDTDVLLLGSSMISNFLDLNDNFHLPLQIMDPRKIAQELNLTFDGFQDYCLMCGTDFTSRIPKIGPVRALKLIRYYGNAFDVLKALNVEEKYIIPTDYIKKFLTAKKLFTDLPSNNELFSFIHNIPKEFLHLSDSTYLDLEKQVLRIFNVQIEELDAKTPWYYHYELEKDVKSTYEY
ncbi:XP-G family nuclease [Schizosaccharomyces pombe]